MARKFFFWNRHPYPEYSYFISSIFAKAWFHKTLTSCNFPTLRGRYILFRCITLLTDNITFSFLKQPSSGENFAFNGHIYQYYASVAPCFTVSSWCLGFERIVIHGSNGVTITLRSLTTIRGMDCHNSM